MTTIVKGAAAETLARDFLVARGFRIIASNQRYEGGELDLVAEHGRVLVFVEVRSRASAQLGSPLETVGVKKRRRVVFAARQWLGEHPEARALPMRFDVVGITYDVDPPRIEHVPDAFDADARVD